MTTATRRPRTTTRRLATGPAQRQPQRAWREGKPYDGAVIDGHLDLNSYAATAVFGVTELAVETISRDGVPVTAASVRALTAVFGRVVLESQAQVTHGDRDWQAGANTRMRGTLRTVVTTMPLPWGGDKRAWCEWGRAATGRCTAIARIALGLFADGPAFDATAVLVTLSPRA
ncbi:hypothetical protein ACFUMH_04075 [Cellulomonas sp. NPDC057328]|uniref:hypothetical protein n=1 Tax=Cellulomonas sp. NPDC057328 TaxID=3346101 RepID=UPI00363A6623